MTGDSGGLFEGDMITGEDSGLCSALPFLASEWEEGRGRSE
jgi:hypothetical protein